MCFYFKCNANKVDVVVNNYQPAELLTQDLVSHLFSFLFLVGVVSIEALAGSFVSFCFDGGARFGPFLALALVAPAPETASSVSSSFTCIRMSAPTNRPCALSMFKSVAAAESSPPRWPRPL